MINTLKRLLKKGLELPLRFLRRHKARNALAQLASHQHPQLKAVGIALQESLSSELSAQEQEVISLIENRRSFLLGSHKEIAVVDYGAGSPSSSRTREEMERGVRATAKVPKITRASKPQFWAIVLFKLIRKLQPLSCVELGSCVGISASYQAHALNINGNGTIVTLEGSPEIANIAVVPYLSDTAVIVFDDISWSPGMRKAWAEIEADDRVSATIDLRTIGIALVTKSLSTRERLEIPL